VSRFALLCVLLCLTGCASVVAGTPSPGSEGPGSDPSTSDTTRKVEPGPYVPPSDGQGFSAEPLDQPTAAPAWNWKASADTWCPGGRTRSPASNRVATGRGRQAGREHADQGAVVQGGRRVRSGGRIVRVDRRAEGRHGRHLAPRAKPGVACKSAEAVLVLGVANLMHDA
jgi:hypothetical protein